MFGVLVRAYIKKNMDQFKHDKWNIFKKCFYKYVNIIYKLF